MGVLEVIRSLQEGLSSQEHSYPAHLRKQTRTSQIKSKLMLEMAYLKFARFTSAKAI